MITIKEEYEGGELATIHVDDNWNKDYPIVIEIMDNEQIASIQLSKKQVTDLIDEIVDMLHNKNNR